MTAVMVQVVEQVVAARMVIEHGANLTAQNNDGVTSGVNAKNKNGLAPFGLPSQGRLA
jgi:hypothetical protein